MQRLTERIDNVPDGESGVWVICTLCIVLCSISSSIWLDMAVGSNFHFTSDY